jgi:UDP-glucose 4-epimerase
MKNILLLGGTGFIGKNVIESYMSNSDVNLTVVARNSKNIEERYLTSENITIKTGSIADFDFIAKTIVDCNVDVVIHLISSIIASSSTEEFYDGLDNVVVPTFKLIDFIADKDIKLVFFSSGGTIYGNSQDVIRESTNLDPINNYGYSKLIIENYIQLKSNTTNLNYIILRPSNVYGKHQVFDSNQGFISVAINKVYHDMPIEIWGDGNTIRDYIDVVDVVSILHKLLVSVTSNVTLNLSTGAGFSLLEIISIIENNLDKQAVVNFNSKRIVDASTVILDNAKLLKIIDHDFIDVNVGIKNQINYFNTILKNAN